MTEAERILWQHLRGHQMQRLHFRRQYVLHGFIADFYCAAARLAIEVDGSIHNQQAEYDHERDIILTADGIRVLRVTNDEVQYHLDVVLSRIRACCDESATTQ
jgi:very-short-patch-repair endonuclease